MEVIHIVHNPYCYVLLINKLSINKIVVKPPGKGKVMRNTEEDTCTTVKNALPYDLQLCPNGDVAITNTVGKTRYVAHAEVMNTLARADLDPHRRRLYEAARDTFPQA